ncbi:Fic family protein [Cupriavidus respiraculi]|nr:Fic family protein [Cupriavidus respiraculi]
MSRSANDTKAVTTSANLLGTLHALSSQGGSQLSSVELATATGVSVATAKRALQRLVASGRVRRTGKARTTRYAATHDFPFAPGAMAVLLREPDVASPPWSAASLRLASVLRRPLMTRDIATYQRGFVDGYVPNRDSLLPRDAADDLAMRARLRGQQPAGTYARRVLEQFLIDLSWSSSRLEGNRFSLVDTRKLFLSGLPGSNADAVMLLNHKRAIEFLVDAAPRGGLTTLLVRNLHGFLMRDLLDDTGSLGAIRNRAVYIGQSTYLPSNVPHVLDEMFRTILEKADRIANPVESAFFLWVNLAYLQAFEDGNKRTSRLTANVPLLLRNCAPLSFLGVDANDYAMAMMGVYERLDTSMAIDLFTWAYGRSIDRYASVLEAMEVPNASALRYRESVNRAVQAIVRDGMPLGEAVALEGRSAVQTSELRRLVEEALRGLQTYNCAHFGIGSETAAAWIARGRPPGPAASGS